jgi:hypothetical protein
MSLDVWPPLPLLIWSGFSETVETSVTRDNVIAEVEHSDRICQIQIYLDRFTTRQIEKLWTAMQVPFPELTTLLLSHRGWSHVPVLPDSFLGGSAPRLRYLQLVFIPFPGLPKLLLSSTHLVGLWLHNIPHSGYISPEAMATCLSALTSLDTLHLEFKSPQSCPDLESGRPFLPTRLVLPTLTKFWFKGVNEYLEEFLARIDAPQVNLLRITFFNDIDFDTPELVQFISRTPALGEYDEARLIFHSDEALVRLGPRPDNGRVKVEVLCQVSDWQLSSLVQICALSLHPLLTMENLYIIDLAYSQVHWKDDIEDTECIRKMTRYLA